jgi:GNAT superfamily N-acetyltransferase
VGNLSFRLYQAKDRTTCREIIHSQVGDFLAPGEDKDFEDVLDRLDSGDANFYYWIGSVDGEDVACGGVQVDDETAQIKWGIVKRGHLRKRFGRKLLEHRLGWLRINRPEVKSVFCDTAPRTEGFFARHGFATYFKKPKYWAGQLDLIAMELSLDGIMRGLERARKEFSSKKLL